MIPTEGTDCRTLARKNASMVEDAVRYDGSRMAKAIYPEPEGGGGCI